MSFSYCFCASLSVECASRVLLKTCDHRLQGCHHTKESFIFYDRNAKCKVPQMYLSSSFLWPSTSFITVPLLCRLPRITSGFQCPIVITLPTALKPIVVGSYAISFSNAVQDPLFVLQPMCLGFLQACCPVSTWTSRECSNFAKVCTKIRSPCRVLRANKGNCSTIRSEKGPFGIHRHSSRDAKKRRRRSAPRFSLLHKLSMDDAK